MGIKAGGGECGGKGEGSEGGGGEGSGERRTEWAMVAAVMAAAAAVMAAAAVAVATRRPRHGEIRNAPSRLPSAWSEAEGIGQRQGNQHWVH